MSSLWPELEPATSVPQNTLRRLAASIAVANGLAATGRSVDITGIDAAAGLLCAQVMDLEAADGSAIRPALVKLELDVGRLIHLMQMARRQPGPPGTTQ